MYYQALGSIWLFCSKEFCASECEQLEADLCKADVFLGNVQ